MGKIVKVHDVAKRSTPLTINGRTVEVPHNTDFPLADAYVEVLTNSRRNFTVIGDCAEKNSAGYEETKNAQDGLLPGAGEAAAAANGGQVPGADSLHHAPPIYANLAVRTDGDVNQVPGGDNLTHAGADGTGESRQLAEDEALAEARNQRQQAIDGTLAPVQVMSAAAVAEEGAPSTTSSDEDAQDPGPLDKSIPDLTEYLAGVSDVDEINRLIKQEKAGKSRVGALDALNARKAELSAE